MVIDIIRISTKIDLTKTPDEIRVDVIDDVWTDFGYWLEVCTFLLKKNAEERVDSVDELVDYDADYGLRHLVREQLMIMM